MLRSRDPWRETLDPATSFRMRRKDLLGGDFKRCEQRGRALPLADVALPGQGPAVGQFQTALGSCQGMDEIAFVHATMIGHMTGRQLTRRPGYEIDIDKVLKACAEYGVAVEINAHPWRLDLDWRWHQKALDYGCIFSINPDAHSIRELDHMHWGVEMARKGGVPPDRVLNAMPLAKLLRHLQRRRQTARHAA